MNSFDLALFDWLNSWAGKSPFWDDIFIFGAVALGWLIISVLFLVLAFDLVFYLKSGFSEAKKAILRKSHWMVAHAFLSAVIAKYVFTDVIKYIFARARPPEVLEGINQLVFYTGGSAFPSGHASFFFAIAAAVYLWRPRWSTLFFAGAILVSVSRVIVGIHWPLDILWGAILGIFSAWLVKFFIKRFQ